MYEATVYVERGGRGDRPMDDVVRIESVGAEIVLRRLFEAL